MNSTRRHAFLALAIAAAALGLVPASPVFAADGEVSPLPNDGPATLAFSDFLRRPIGPRGLEPGPRLLALDGQRVRLAGYPARGVEMPAQTAILASVPVALDDEDESLADDLPAAVAYLHWTDPRVGDALAACGRALRVSGRLELGARAEADGRRSFVRVQVDDVQCAGR